MAGIVDKDIQRMWANRSSEMAILGIEPMRKDLERIVGKRLCLRLVMPEDAQYIYRLRTDPAHNAYLSRVDGAVAEQRVWIERYKLREAAGEELYYIIEKSDGTRCGVVRLYEITSESFTWGSWILDRNKPDKAALESAVLSFAVGFDCLDLSKAFLHVRVENAHAISFYRRFRMIEIGSDSENIYFEYPRDQFLRDRALHMTMIKTGINE